MTNAEKHAAMMKAEEKISAAYAEKAAIEKELLPKEPFFYVFASGFGWQANCPSYSGIWASSSIDEGPEMALSRIKDEVNKHLNRKVV